MKSFTIVVKRPGKSPYLAQVEDSLEAMQKLVGGYIERLDGVASGVGADIDMYSNECAKIIGSVPNLWLFDKFDQIWGPCFFIGGDDETGELRSLTDAEIVLVLEWCKENTIG